MAKRRHLAHSSGGRSFLGVGGGNSGNRTSLAPVRFAGRRSITPSLGRGGPGCPAEEPLPTGGGGCGVPKSVANDAA